MSAAGEKPNYFDPLRFCQGTPAAAAERRELIAKAAYYRAERRAFGPGHELEDWLAAETEVDQRGNAAAPRR
jgi:Protein of unknown function (DUF2934)